MSDADRIKELEERLEAMESFRPFIIQLQMALRDMALHPMFSAFLSPSQKSFLLSMTED